MAHDEMLAQRIRQILADEAGLVEKKMFGGVGFMIRGNMACGVHKDSFIVRVGPQGHDAAMARPHTRLFDITGRAMTGWVMVDAAGVENDANLRAWVREGVEFARMLPAK